MMMMMNVWVSKDNNNNKFTWKWQSTVYIHTNPHYSHSSFSMLGQCMRMRMLTTSFKIAPCTPLTDREKAIIGRDKLGLVRDIIYREDEIEKLKALLALEEERRHRGCRASEDALKDAVKTLETEKKSLESAVGNQKIAIQSLVRELKALKTKVASMQSALETDPYALATVRSSLAETLSPLMDNLRLCLTDPVSRQLFTHPVLTSTGHTFEREGAERFTSSVENPRRISPLTRLTLVPVCRDKYFVDNHCVRAVRSAGRGIQEPGRPQDVEHRVSGEYVVVVIIILLSMHAFLWIINPLLHVLFHYQDIIIPPSPLPDPHHRVERREAAGAVLPDDAKHALVLGPDVAGGVGGRVAFPQVLEVDHLEKASGQRGADGVLAAHLVAEEVGDDALDAADDEQVPIVFAAREDLEHKGAERGGDRDRELLVQLLVERGEHLHSGVSCRALVLAPGEVPLTLELIKRNGDDILPH